MISVKCKRKKSLKSSPRTEVYLSSVCTLGFTNVDALDSQIHTSAQFKYNQGLLINSSFEAHSSHCNNYGTETQHSM